MPLLRQGTAGRPAAIERLEGRRLLSATLTTLATFATATGGDPNGGLIADAAGDLFGTAMYGGPASAGTVFEIAAGSGTVTPLAAFGGTNGQDPAGGLAMDAAGDLFGTTELGGTDNDGTVFEVPAGGGGIVTLASFDGTDGSLPQGTPHLDAAGDLYGTAEDGGAGMAGTVFEVVAGSGAITTLASFPGYPSAAGAQPRAGVVADAAGDLFGTTYQGGAGGQGTLFEVAEGSGTVRGLASFNGPGAGTNGALALGELTLDASGDLFGTASQGGADDDGAVFEYAPATATLTTVASFDGADGKAPQGGLTADAAGDLFGSTAVGGANALGTVFEIPAGSGAVTTLVSFGGPDGSGPYGGLHLDAAGNLFGATEAGGPMGNGHIDQDLDGFGVAFEVSPGGATPTPTPTPTPTSTASPLVPTSGKSTVPAELVVGAKLKGKVTVTLTNGGGSTLKGTDVVSLYAVGADQAATAGTLVGTTRAKPTLAAGRSATVGVAVRPVAVPAGSYTLLGGGDRRGGRGIDGGDGTGGDGRAGDGGAVGDRHGQADGGRAGPGGGVHARRDQRRQRQVGRGRDGRRLPVGRRDDAYRGRRHCPGGTDDPAGPIGHGAGEVQGGSDDGGGPVPVGRVHAGRVHRHGRRHVDRDGRLTPGRPRR